MWTPEAREAAAAARAASGKQKGQSGNTMALGGGRYGIIGSDGRVRPVDATGHVQAIADQHGIPTGHLSNDDRDRNGYSRSSVQKAIDMHNARRSGSGRIGGREASMIHALLRGRG